MRIYNINILALFIFFQYGCSSKFIRHYKLVNEGHEQLVNKNFSAALQKYETADKINKSNLFKNDLCKYLTACYSDNKYKQKKYFGEILNNLDCDNYISSLKEKGNFSFTKRQKMSIQTKNSATLFLDSLVDKDQFNRDFISFKEKKNRDSLHLLHFLDYIKKYGFPNEKTTKINCFRSGTGTDLNRLEILLLHFSGFKNAQLDSILINEAEKLNVSPEVLASANFNIKEATRFSLTYLIINDTLYINNVSLTNRKKINKMRLRYGLPSIELEYLLIKNQDELRDLGFRLNFSVNQIELPSIPDAFTPENIFVKLL